MRNAKFWINKTSNQNIEGFMIKLCFKTKELNLSFNPVFFLAVPTKVDFFCVRVLFGNRKYPTKSQPKQFSYFSVFSSSVNEIFFQYFCFLFKKTARF